MKIFCVRHWAPLVGNHWVKANESTIFLEDFNAHIVNDIDIWKDVIGRYRDGLT